MISPPAAFAERRSAGRPEAGCHAAVTVAAIATLLGVVHGCTTDGEDPLFLNPLDPMVGAGLPVPESIEASAGDNVVVLRWALPDGVVADEYAVFRRRVDVAGEAERLLGRIAEVSFTDTSARNDRTYEYRVAAGVDGKFGARSERVTATPGFFTIVISGDAIVTRLRSVTVSTSVAGATSVQLSEDVDAFTAPWRSISEPLVWTLGAGDGTKTVYARFRMVDGTISLPVSDSIRLDTRAIIESVDFDGSDMRAPGESVHFRIVAGEADGTARITVSGLFTNTELFDDGTAGDAVAGDGTYERDLEIPLEASAVEESVRGSFTDQAGNQAEPMTGPRLLTAQADLEAVELTELRVSHPPDEAGATLRWRRYLESDFSRYRIVRSESSPVDSSDEQIAAITASGTEAFEDREVVESVTYYYRVFVEDRWGRQSGSNEMSALIPNERPPEGVSIQSALATSVDRVALGWSRSTARDFLEYRIYRNETGAVTDQDALIAQLTDISRTFWDDDGLRENTTYYYRVYTVDRGGLAGRSAEAPATTRNQAPPPVLLQDATDVGSTAATLTWQPSDVHDFAAYELYRDEIATVTRASTLVAELDHPTFTSVRDDGLEAGTLYYYRVFVVDDAGDPMFAGSNTLSVSTTNPRATP